VSGHLFVFRGDLTRLNCDAWLLPTDRNGTVNPAWASADELAPLVDTLRLRQPRSAEWRAEKQRAQNLRSPGRGKPGIWAVNTGGDEQRASQWYFDGVTAFLNAAADARVLERQMPLIGLPFVGAGWGGQAPRKGGFLTDLLKFLGAEVQRRQIDIALVNPDAAVHAAAQAIRRDEPDRFWPSFPYAREVGDLARAAEDQRLVLFVGAGASIGAGLPTWSALLELLAAHAGLTPAELRRLAAVTDQARLIEQRLERLQATHLRELIVELFSKQSHHSLVHGLLASLPVDQLVTTNYDSLLESAAEGGRRALAVIPYERVGDSGRWLLKMHGSIDHPEDIVLTRADYLKYAYQRGALAGIVQALLITRHMLFVGFSLQDDNFQRVADDVRRAVRAPRSGEAQPFGTVLQLGEDPILAELWEEDLRVVSMGPASRQPSLARKLEVFLDRLLAESTAAGSHLLDPSFGALLRPDELELRDRLIDIADQSGRLRTTPAWSSLERMLQDLGYTGRAGSAGSVRSA
jgi:hypothetical protein